jgi:hypothetical protein
LMLNVYDISINVMFFFGVRFWWSFWVEFLLSF